MIDGRATGRPLIAQTDGRWSGQSSGVGRAFAAAKRSFILIAALVVLVLPASGWSAQEASPLVQVTRNELRLSTPVPSLVADNGRAAFGLKSDPRYSIADTLGVWQPGKTSILRFGPPDAINPQRILSFAIADDRVAWVIDRGGITISNVAFTATLASPQKVTWLAETAHCCRGIADAERMGDLVGAGNLLVFVTHDKCGFEGGIFMPPCDLTAGGAYVYRVWRVVHPPFSSVPNCAELGSCVTIASATSPLEPLSVDSGRVALMHGDGTIDVRTGDGALVRTFGQLPGKPRAAQLMGNALVVLSADRILSFDLSSGRQLHTWTVGGTVQLLDAARGYVAYLVGGKLQLLRLRDGAKRVVAAATDARFGGTGLFYSYTTSGAWPGRIRFLPWSALPLRP
jgi:hypothetical protein